MSMVESSFLMNKNYTIRGDLQIKINQKLKGVQEIAQPTPLLSSAVDGEFR